MRLLSTASKIPKQLEYKKKDGILMDCAKIVGNIRAEIKKYVADNGLKALVLGVSGGIDSAVVAALAYPVCTELGIPLIGRSIKIVTNSKRETDYAKEIGYYFCTDFKEVDFSEEYVRTKEQFESVENPKDDGIDRAIRNGNLKARIRMMYLYDIAQYNRGLVIGTDNRTEELLGFFTIHGDHFDYNPIQKLYKTEVYEIAQYLQSTLTCIGAIQALQYCIDITPTDGLGISGSDLEQIGISTYAEVDKRLQDYLLDKTEIEGCPVIARHKKSEFKRNWPFSITRETLEA